MFLFGDSLPIVLGQSELTNNFWDNAGADPQTLIIIIGSLTVITLLTIYLSFKLKRLKKQKEFEKEMKSLNLDPNEEGTFSSLVWRYTIDEPVEVIYSPAKFDEIATQEIQRVLASHASAKNKKNFIDTIYDIRLKTYHPEWVREQE